MQRVKTPLMRVSKKASNISGVGNTSLDNVQSNKSSTLIEEMGEPDGMMNMQEIQEMMEQFNDKFDEFTDRILDEIDQVKKE